jgi:hypothetical protein
MLLCSLSRDTNYGSNQDFEFFYFILYFSAEYLHRSKVAKLWGALLVLGVGESCLYEGQNIYFGRHFACLKYEARIILYLKFHWSVYELRKVCYSPAKLYVICFFLICSGGGGVKLMKHFKGGASYKSLETFAIDNRMDGLYRTSPWALGFWIRNPLGTLKYAIFFVLSRVRRAFKRHTFHQRNSTEFLIHKKIEIFTPLTKTEEDQQWKKRRVVYNGVNNYWLVVCMDLSHCTATWPIMHMSAVKMSDEEIKFFIM